MKGGKILKRVASSALPALALRELSNLELLKVANQANALKSADESGKILFGLCALEVLKRFCEGRVK